MPSYSSSDPKNRIIKMPSTYCTDDFWQDFRSFQAKGVVFVREPREEPYGTVAVFQDLYGNLWDLLQPRLPVGAAR
jgi:uncharacterized glyoxalase superfamily protein PhnB